MNVKQIVLEYLEANGFDGLYDSDAECGCHRDHLMPCGEGADVCCPGYARPDPSGEEKFVIGPEKAEEAKDGPA